MSTASFIPLKLSGQPLVLKITAIMLGTVFLAASSWIEVPMVPVPMTMQTFAVTLVGALYGWRLGAITVLAWLAQGMMGFPVLAGGAGGLAHFAGPTAGYLAGFVVAAAMVGFLAERGWTAGVVRGSLTMLLGNILILAVGWVWLAAMIGAESALIHGVTPFLLGGLLKSLLASLTVLAAGRASLFLR
ncbi:biotin transporter BioY [Mesorhizobium sp. NBSH29]|nr:biotin transporter BioY [Mesorhizobium sp. NBSH29]